MDMKVDTYELQLTIDEVYDLIHNIELRFCRVADISDTTTLSKVLRSLKAQRLANLEVKHE